MRIVYHAAHASEAHVIRQLLESEGIPAFVQGEFLQGAVGLLPANVEILVHVRDEDYAAAREIAESWAAARPGPDDVDAFDTGDASAEALADDTSAEDEMTTGPGHPWTLGKTFLIWAIMAIVIGGALVYMQRHPDGP